MDLEQARLYCLSKNGTEESFPFGPETLVFKVAGKIFALMGLESENPGINLKCDPDLAIELRERYAEVQPGYHMDKNHWNTVMLEQSLSDAELKGMIDHSYQLVVAGLPAKVRQALTENL
jgi:predicted DNA-binding protein (MmcQ/YjbR family)